MKLLNTKNKELLNFKNLHKLNSNIYLLNDLENLELYRSSVVIGAFNQYKNVKLKRGDKVLLKNQNGKSQDFYIAYFLNKNDIVLSLNKPTSNIFKYLMKNVFKSL